MSTRPYHIQQPSSPSQTEMVSHAEVADRASSSRRAPSVSSRSHRSRHHHRGRSHQGGSAYTPQNEFPFFAQTGDVEIVIAADGMEKRYLLHRLILAQCSSFFEAGTSEEWSRGQAMQELPTRDVRNDQALTIIGEEGDATPATPVITPAQIPRLAPGRKRWRYELDWEHAEEDEEPMLVQKPPSSGGLFSSDFQPVAPPQRPKPVPPVQQHTSFFRSMANLTLGSNHQYSQSTTNLASPINVPPADPALSSPTIRDYDNLFRTFYNYVPNLNPTNIATAYSECKALLTLADMYDALHVVGSRIDHHLLRFSGRLFKQIAKYPASYLKLGYLARSRIIFSEALTHVVGQWPQPYAYLRDPDGIAGGYTVPESVIDLIEDKVDELEELKARVESKLFRLTLTTSRGERVNPTNDYLGWLAMSLFRQWLAENTTPPPQSILKTNGQSSQPTDVTQTPPHHQQRPPNTPATAAVTTTPTRPPNPTTTTPTQSHPSRPPAPPIQSTSRVYRLLGSSNPQSYLPSPELKTFLKQTDPSYHPSSSHRSRSNRFTDRSGSGAGGWYSKDNLKRFERRMEEVKNLARDVVRPLVRCVLELDVRLLESGSDGVDAGGVGSGTGVGTGGLGYLVCMGLREGEVPWD